jgi:hypothetical protein
MLGRGPIIVNAGSVRIIRYEKINIFRGGATSHRHSNFFSGHLSATAPLCCRDLACLYIRSGAKEICLL